MRPIYFGINAAFFTLVASQSPYMGMEQCGRDCAGGSASDAACSTIDMECMCGAAATSNVNSCCIAYGCSGVPDVTSAIRSWILTCREYNVALAPTDFVCDDVPLLNETSIPDLQPSSSGSSSPSQTSESGGSASTSDTNASSAPSSGSAQSSGSADSSTSGGTPNGTVIGAAVGASVGGIAIIALAAGLFFYRRRSKKATAAAAATSVPQGFNQGFNGPPDMSYGGGYMSNHGDDAFHPDNFKATPVDDDTLAKMRRFSDDGTVAMTVAMTAAGRTNDDYRPMPA